MELIPSVHEQHSMAKVPNMYVHHEKPLSMACVMCFHSFLNHCRWVVFNMNRVRDHIVRWGKLPAWVSIPVMIPDDYWFRKVELRFE
jgi:hypothetical protein